MLHLPSLPSDTLGRLSPCGTLRLIAFYGRKVPGFGSVAYSLWTVIGG